MEGLSVEEYFTEMWTRGSKIQITVASLPTNALTHPAVCQQQWISASISTVKLAWTSTTRTYYSEYRILAMLRRCVTVPPVKDVVQMRDVLRGIRYIFYYL
jgi:hypothetical protein